MHDAVDELVQFRNRLHALHLIGAYADGIGFGNISHRESGNQFIISGTQTGHIATADVSHFSLVERCDIKQNELYCSGPVKASSEALTHFSFYEAAPQINAVIHVHHLALWKKLLFRVPTVPEQIAYGTTEMAEEIKKMMPEMKTDQEIVVTAGHQEGIFTFGNTLSSAFALLMRYYNEL